MKTQHVYRAFLDHEPTRRVKRAASSTSQERADANAASSRWVDTDQPYMVGEVDMTLAPAEAGKYFGLICCASVAYLADSKGKGRLSRP